MGVLAEVLVRFFRSVAFLRAILPIKTVTEAAASRWTTFSLPDEEQAKHDTPNADAWH